MRKFVLFLAVLFMTVPAMAVSNVGITCAEDGNEVTVSYTTDANLIRAFGLDITITTADANIVELVMVDPNYRIYPGQIVIVDGNVINDGTPYVLSDLGDANLAVEMGSLYTMDPCYENADPNLGYGMQPDANGVLFKFYVDGDCNYAVTENEIRGGVVMEDPTEDPNLTLCSGNVTLGCYPSCLPDYAEWVAVGSPDCWCFPRQCHGDADGQQHQEKGLLDFWVGVPDLQILSIGWKKADTDPSFSTFICADFDHTAHTEKGIPHSFRVGVPDLQTLSTYWKGPNGGKPEPPADCLDCP